MSIISNRLSLKILFLAAMFVGNFVFAQDYSAAANSSGSQSQAVTSFRRGVATAVLCGLGGAVLGLSTLSFYGQPQEHISNVTTGFGVGLLAGIIYVTTESTKTGPLAQKSFDDSNLGWAQLAPNRASKSVRSNQNLVLNYGWVF